MSWTPVIDIMACWDRPRRGVALKGDQLVYFECRYDEAEDDYSPEYGVKPISRDLLPPIAERRAIFNRWSDALHAANTKIETHPALPVDRARWDELGGMIDPEMKMDWSTAPLARPKFRRAEGEQDSWELDWGD
jgi:hypothetical protein